jgi:hypothetical protein
MLLPDTQLLESLTNAFKTIQHASKGSFTKAKEIRSTLLANDKVSATAKLVSEILEEQGFVQIRGFSATEADQILAGWTCLLGDPHIDMDHGGGAIPAEVRPGQHLMGNQLRLLPLHTDYSMLESPPWLTVSFCRHSDPTKGLGDLAVVDAEAAWFGLESGQEFSQLSSVLFPFAGMSRGNTPEVIHRPIISASVDDSSFLVRYHRSRIVQGFRCTKTTATAEQVRLMMYFEDRMNLLSHSLTIQSGDLTIIDNHRMLHGRGRCSVSVSNDMTVSGRKMLFAFAHSIKPYDLSRR